MTNHITQPAASKAHATRLFPINEPIASLPEDRTFNAAV